MSVYVRKGEKAYVAASLLDYSEENIPHDEGVFAFTFEEIMTYAREKYPDSLTNGMVWSFQIKGISFSHETDDRYIVSTNNHVWSNFTKEMLLVVEFSSHDIFAWKSCSLAEKEFFLRNYKLALERPISFFTQAGTFGDHYVSSRTVKVKPMTRLEYNVYRGWKLPTDENGSDTGFLVEETGDSVPNDPRHSGYINWMPTAAFEKTFKAVKPSEEEPPAPDESAAISGLDFGDALQYLESGCRLARDGWNGKGMFVYLVPPASYPVQTGAVKAHFGEGSMVPYNAYFAIKNVDDTVSTWVPSVNDCLAKDWSVL